MVYIFDLDGTLADCSHRRHFVDASLNPDYELTDRIHYSEYNEFLHGSERQHLIPRWQHKVTGKKWKPDWDSFYEACDKDTPIRPVINIFNKLILLDTEIQIWSGRSESVKVKTKRWLDDHVFFNCEYPVVLKMRPIGDSTPDDQLKEQWLNERCSDYIACQMSEKMTPPIPCKHDIEAVFDDRIRVLSMWERRGIWTFNCNQGKGAY